MIDVSKLSLKELQELQNQINKEKSKREACNKSAVYGPFYRELYDRVDKRLEAFSRETSAELDKDETSRIHSTINANILKLCDLAFMNTSVNKKGRIVCHSGPDLYLIGDAVKDYKAMYEEIIKTFFKYVDKEINLAQ